MSTDIRLDPSDPLSLLLQNPVGGESSASSNGDDSGASSIGSPQDWTQLSTLWDGTDPTAPGGVGMQKYNDLMDFNDLNGPLDMNMDMEFDPTMGLHYGGYGAFDTTSAFNLQLDSLLPQTQFPFSFQAALNAVGSSPSSFSSGASTSSTHSVSSGSFKERRLSVGSSVSASSSGASLSAGDADTSNANSPSALSGASDGFSPLPQPTTPKVEVKKQESESPRAFDPAMEIAERVRQSAGVMLAVPMNAQYAQQALTGSFDASTPQASQSKIPIPRLPRQSSSPKSPHSSSSSAASTPPPATPPLSSALPAKLTINTKSSASASSSSLPTPTTAMPTPSTSTAAPGGPGARPKTSHTTIERRYRTNLNARIQSLRMAVPALRVLEDREGGNGKKIKKNLKDGVYVKGAGIGIDGADGTVDVIDERGFVDGVKVARKCSKANVLGKAVEYIRVLKKREIRLKAEQNGLKALVCGLVGGPALLKEWEARWRERFGGEEKDEVEGEEAEPEEDSDEDDDGDDGEVGKKRKRAKTTAAGYKKTASGVFDKRSTATAGIPPPNVASVITQLGGVAPGADGAPMVPEKRKRGRPRKVPAAPTPVTTLAPQQDVMMQGQEQHVMLAPPIELHQHGSQPQQYLLAVFALFSFFNSPLTSSFTSSPSSGSAHQHTGVLLNKVPLVLAPEIVSQFSPPPPVQSAAMVAGWTWAEWAQGLHLAVSLVVLGGLVCSWMGVSVSLKRTKKAGVKEGDTRRRVEDGNVDWAAVCHDVVLNGSYKSLSIPSTLRMYTSLLSTQPRSIPHLTSAALLLHTKGGLLFNTLARAKARSLWNTAKAHSEMPLPPSARKGGPVSVKLHERLVLESWTIEEAAGYLPTTGVADTEGEELSAGTPIEALAGVLVKQRVKGHLKWLFVDAVGVVESEDDEREKATEKAESEKKVEEVEMRRTIEAARELGGDVEELGRTLERVWKQPANLFLDDLPSSLVVVDSDDSDSEDGEDVQGEVLDKEIKALLTGLVLYRQVFGVQKSSRKKGGVVSVTSALISPPPSPTATIRSGVRASGGAQGKERNVLWDLRRALGDRVFEAGSENQEQEGGEGARLEDARDRVVDLVVEMERRGRSVTP